MAGIVILEGPDCAGKTTLANAIRYRDSTCKYIHMTYRFKERMGLYHTAALHRAIQYSILGFNVIIDRCWPSAEIYSQVFRNDNRWNNLGRRLNPLMYKYGLTVVCLPDFDQVAMLHMQRLSQEMYQNPGDIERIYDAYAGLCYGDETSKLGGLVGKLTRNGGVLHLKNWLVVDPFTSKVLPERLLLRLNKDF